MIALAFAVIAYCRAFFIGRHRHGMEVAALRHQLVVCKRTQPRPRLCSCDRAFWVGLRRLWPGWVNALIIVKPDTVVSWRRAAFRLFWRLRSRHVIPLNERHLTRLSLEYVRYYQDDRTHLGLNKETPSARLTEMRPDLPSTIRAEPRIGGLHHESVRTRVRGKVGLQLVRYAKVADRRP